MLTSTDIHTQYAAAEPDQLRVLVVGAGIAGVTAAGLLRSQGLHPVLIERADTEAVHSGYMLVLMPMVDVALDELGVHDAYREASIPFSRYAVHSHTGRTMRVDSIAAVLSRYGDYRGLDRGALIDVLSSPGGEVTYGTTVSSLREKAERVIATIASGDDRQELEFDLVIVADGLHSRTRKLVLGDRPVQRIDTGWGGWVVWVPGDDEPDLGEELWGAGTMLGMYPVPGRVGAFLCGPNADTVVGPAAFAAGFRSTLTTVSPRIARVLDTVASAEDPYYWQMEDRRAPEWVAGRTVLLGDAAAGFMPTAGIGAGMAIESAWMLAGALRDAAPHDVPGLLRSYERTQRPRVEAAQKNSRTLARLMFRRSRALAVARDLAVRYVSVSVALGPIRRLLETTPDPRSIAMITEPSRSR